MPSRSLVPLALALALSCAAVGGVWAGGAAATAVTIEDARLFEAIVGPFQGKEASFEVKEGLDTRSILDCVALTRGTRWTFEVKDKSGDGALDATFLPGFALDAPSASLTVTGGSLSGFCAQDDDEDGSVDRYAHLIVSDGDALVVLKGVGLGADTSRVPAEAPRVGLFISAGTVSVAEQEAIGLPFTAAQLIGGTFTQEGGQYSGGVGSAIVASGGNVSLNGVSFVGGRSDRGAGVNVEGGLLLVYRALFQGGEATSYGGAIAAQDATVQLTDVEVLNNHAAQGGGLWAQGGSVAVLGGALSGNVSDGEGGGLYAQGAEVTLEGALVESNLSVSDGGGLYVGGDEGLLTLIEDTQLIENDAGGYGGGAFVDGAALSGSALSARGNGASFGGALAARSSAWVELSDVSLDRDEASLKGGGLYLQQVSEARLCGLQVSGATAALSGGGIYATDSGLTLGAADGSCEASAVVGATAPEGAALTLIDTSAAPDGLGLGAVGLQLTQLNPDTADRTFSEDQALFVSTPGALTLDGLSTPGGLGSLALLTAVEAEVTLLDVQLIDEAVTSPAQYAALQQAALRLTRPALVDIQGARICGFVASSDTFGLVQVDAPAGDVVIGRSVLTGAQGFKSLVRVVPDDSGVSDVEVTLAHNSLIGAFKDSSDGAFLRAERVVATGNLLHRLGAGLTLDGLSGVAETYNLFSDAVSRPLLDGGGSLARVDESSTDEVAALGLVSAFVEGSCAVLPELLEESPAVNGGDPAGARDPDGSIADQGALPVTLADSDDDGSYDIDDCAPEDPTIGDTLAEIYGDGIDNDCDPETIDDDEDGDGLLRGVDCDDTDPSPCPLVSLYSGGCAGCASDAPSPGPTLLWLAPLTLLFGRRRHRQER